MNRKCFKPFTNVHPNNANHKRSSVSGGLCPHTPYRGFPLDPNGDFRPQAPYIQDHHLAKPAYAAVGGGN